MRPVAPRDPSLVIMRVVAVRPRDNAHDHEEGKRRKEGGKRE
jgi:hypothetical protein